MIWLRHDLRFHLRRRTFEDLHEDWTFFRETSGDAPKPRAPAGFVRCAHQVSPNGGRAERACQVLEPPHGSSGSLPGTRHPETFDPKRIEKGRFLL